MGSTKRKPRTPERVRVNEAPYARWPGWTVEGQAEELRRRAEIQLSSADRARFLEWAAAVEAGARA